METKPAKNGVCPPEKSCKKKRRDKSDLGPNFVAPDGGWGWAVCFAGGLSTLSIFPVIQQFGLIYRERLMDLNISNSQITTLINANNALSSVTGLLNGPLFRRFTFRQVGIGAALLNVLGLFCATLSNSFLSYFISIAILYGAGFGLFASASSLALNTYFKEKRRFAAGFSWTMTSLGPIVMPYVVTALLREYGVQGTVLIFTGLAMHAVAGAMIFQPVLWHTKPQKPDPAQVEKEEYLCSYCRLRKMKSSSLLASQYIYTEDDKDMPGYEIFDPATPMMAKANDGWYSPPSRCSSRLSLTSGKWKSTQNIPRNKFSSPNFSKLQVPENSEEQMRHYLPNNFNREKEARLASEIKGQFEKPKMCTCDEERKLLAAEQKEEECEEKDENLPFWRKVVIFFDLDLLRDFTYVNLMLGITIANFAEINFSILTPFILSDFGFDKPQIALMMSLLASMDTGMRFMIPFIAEKIGWDNQTFFLLGVLGMACGRIVIAHFHSLQMILIAGAWIGMCKALRTVFLALIIPGYVPLNRLPAASGLQLLVSGMFTLMAGPLVGVIRDKTNYVFTLHCLNVLTFTTVICWTVGAIINRRKRNKQKAQTSPEEE
ncbi:unnamed protein product [Hermetia illucens]|uniref:Monocarboxylate transporter 9 n=1 Tax=Hermetia illucens TaxID=343691 RepID=A0A7R8V1D3_HERIL|nr:uncharacterized protein LOC119657277 [Hermetia illucens]XP_037920045.1 uncharacterized protein LOC119657277 [Hermetia illucens]XP_037920046.1 uncharacterized protein LOC119657277 [Hermetia illucens]XP_037920047.1 uncharacterized protein LOC119657277 [Hermetia illucens]XP_037920048.1 uncharacterized protein LOC119657277 [Hermetia illucens]XP_037920049.1 uncharacterized protein LOC119657277 [Hermetia illucens]CAD7089844.1 unnamed protein product [Hermetia illucens]